MKIRYNPFPRVVLDGLTKLGIKIDPYYVFREGLFDGVLPPLKVRQDEYELGFLGPEDMKVIASIPFREFSHEQLMTRLKEGKMCFGAKQRERLAAFTWCDVEECNCEGLRFQLKDDEAYLFDAHTMDSFRGKGIAPYLRYQLYKKLAKLGRTKLYSISIRFNAPSLKFKEKLNAKLIGSGLFIELFHRWHFSSISEKDIMRD
ncbi:MAG: hypothetical protein JRF64_02805 [Deltaproteobacteria bacterium]|nr:hypothetical protein [Deltaproteobacteria bacterium]